MNEPLNFEKSLKSGVCRKNRPKSADFRAILSSCHLVMQELKVDFEGVFPSSKVANLCEHTLGGVFPRSAHTNTSFGLEIFISFSENSLKASREN